LNSTLSKLLVTTGRPQCFIAQNAAARSTKPSRTPPNSVPATFWLCGSARSAKVTCDTRTGRGVSGSKGVWFR